MTLDTELRRTFDALAERLHAEVERQVRAAIAELPAQAPGADSGETSSSAPTSDQAIAPPSGEAVGPSAQGNLDGALIDAIRLMDESRSLSDVLDALTTGVASGGGGVAIVLRRDGRWHAWRTIGCEPEVDADRLANRASAPLVISGQTIGVVYAEHGPTAGLEILARHASRCLESMTAFRTARALARQHDPAHPSADLGEEDTSARRYAKLLVSEIKLYHPTDVAAGCRERDLAARLGGEIARARVLYEQRVPLNVRNRADYFHEELVRTLADGDASLLKTDL